jgi:hypothetical protein
MEKAKLEAAARLERQRLEEKKGRALSLSVWFY